MLKHLDTTLPVAESSELAEPETAGRFFLACRGIPDYLMTLIRGGLAESVGAERTNRVCRSGSKSLNGSWPTSVSWASKPIRSWARGTLRPSTVWRRPTRSVARASVYRRELPDDDRN